MTDEIGFIGTGLLGRAMCEMLVRAGRRLVVWDIDPEVRGSFAGRPEIEVAATSSEVAARVKIVMLCVVDTGAVRSVVFGDDGVAGTAGAEHIIVDHSTTLPDATTALAERLASETRARWVDAPVSGGPAFARDRRLTVMAGGERDAFEAVRPLMEAYAHNVTLMGGPGSGQAAKAINQALTGVGYVLMAEALRLAEAGPLDPALLPQCLSGGHADSTMLHFAYPKMLERDFEPPLSRSRQMLKDMQNVLKDARAARLDLPLLQAAARQFTAYVDQGGGDRETASIIDIYPKSTRTERSGI